MSAQRRICVLTGDIVRSSRLDPRELEDLMQTLKRSSESLRNWTSTKGRPLERFRGDGWQIALTESEFCLRAALFIRAAVRSWSNDADTRIGIGLGTGAIARTLASSSGAAFEMSGQQLEQIRGQERWSFDAEGMASPALELTRALLTSCEGWSSGWTSKQSQVVALAIQPDKPTMTEVANELNVTQQTAQEHFTKAGGRALLRVIEIYENADRKNRL
jgi:hypothetical protein